MVRIFTLLVFLSLINISGSFAQKLYANNWYISNKGMLSFSTGSPVITTIPELYASEGIATISDPYSGQLLFYTNSKVIRNRLHDTMPNGTNLKSCTGASTSSTQAALIVPDPGNPSKRFYCFITDCIESDTNQGLNYNIINMNLDSGKGDVEPENKNILLLENVTEKVAATHHANGKDYWIVTQNISGKYWSYLLTENGIVDSIFSFGKHKLGYWGGAIKISPDGKWISNALAGNSIIELFEFNNQTGQMEYFCRLQGLNIPYSGSFSLNSAVFYCGDWTGNKILGWNLSFSDTSLIQSSVKELVGGKGALQIGPDKKIYRREGSPYYLGAIDNSDNIDSCSFSLNNLWIYPSTSGHGLPNIIDSWFLSDSLFTNHLIFETKSIFQAFYSSNTIIGSNSSSSSGTYHVYDLTGRILFSGIVNPGNFQINASILGKGIYLIRFSNQVNHSLFNLKFFKS